MRKNTQLPNLHNLGIHLRILLVVNLLVALAAYLLTHQSNEFIALLIGILAVVQPILLLSLLTLYVLYPRLKKLSYWQGLEAVMALEIAITGLVVLSFNYYFSFVVTTNPYRACAIAAIVTAILLYYFYLQQRAYSPAIAEARLQALQARIRPHFLFNSINAVLSVIRSQPKLAETALEDMADLFRVLMADNRDLVPLIQEIAISRQYLALEKLRLEDRLQVNWQIDGAPPNAMIPPLILQPLLENAVYHGIEPMSDGGEISVQIYSKSQELHIIISNPYAPHNDHHNGNKMALANIKERLQLHFDLEAALKMQTKDNRYEVHIRLPLGAS